MSYAGTRTQVLDVVTAIESRRSIRKYAQDPIPSEDLERMLHLTSLAPSAWNLQAWRMTVVTDSDTKARLQVAAYGQAQVGSAPDLVIITSDMEDVLSNLHEVPHPKMPAEAQDRMIKTVQDLFLPQGTEARGQWGLTQVKSILDLPEHVQIAALVAVGHGTEDGFAHHRHPVDRVVAYHEPRWRASA